MDPIAFGFRMTKAKRQAKETTGGATWKNAQDFLQMELFGLALPSPFLKLKRALKLALPQNLRRTRRHAEYKAIWKLRNKAKKCCRRQNRRH